MRALSRACVALGGLLLAASFVLPWGFFNSPLERVKWAWAATTPLEASWENAAFLAATLAIVYPYVWALAVTLTWPWRRALASRAVLAVHLACHAMGGAAIAFIGILLLAARDTWMPTAVQWAAAVAPCAVLALMGLAAVRLAPARRLAAVCAIGLVPQVPLQFALAWETRIEGYSAWGFGLGGLGAVLALAGTVTAILTMTLHSKGEINIDQK